MTRARIKTLRLLKGLTQKEMAELLYKSASAYSRIESGKHPISIDELRNIATVLGCQIETLLYGEGFASIPVHTKDKDGENEGTDKARTDAYKELLLSVMETQQKTIEEIKLLAAEREQMGILLKELMTILKKQEGLKS